MDVCLSPNGRTSYTAPARVDRPAILRSRDGGATWQELTAGLPADLRGNIEAMTMKYGPHGVEFFAGTATGSAVMASR